MVAVALPVAMAGAAEPAAQEGDQAPEITARAWLNPQAVSLHTPVDTYVLVFYDVRNAAVSAATTAPAGDKNGEAERAKEQNATVDRVRVLVRQLNRIDDHYRKQGLQVVGLTHEGSDRAQAFVKRFGVSHKLGAVSFARREYGIPELPYLVLVHQGAVRWRGTRVEDLLKQIEKVMRARGRAAPGGGSALLELETKDAPDALTDDERREEFARSMAATERAEEELNWLVDQMLGSLGPTEPLEPEDLAPLDAYYEAGWLAAQAGGPVSPVTRGELIRTGYKRLLESGRLSPAARRHLRDRLLDMYRQETDNGLLAQAVIYLKYFVEPGDEEARSLLRDLCAREGEPFLRKDLAIALEWLDPATTDQTKRYYGGAARYFVGEMDRSADPAASRWTEAHAYRESVRQRCEKDLVADYEGHLRTSQDDRQRENDLIIRWLAAQQLSFQASRTENPAALRQTVLSMLEKEPDHGIRFWLVNAVVKDCAQTDARTREELTKVFQRQLPSELPTSSARAYMEYALQEWGVLPAGESPAP